MSAIYLFLIAGIALNLPMTSKASENQNDRYLTVALDQTSLELVNMYISAWLDAEKDPVFRDEIEKSV